MHFFDEFRSFKEVSVVGYGPFDNGYLLLGLESGVLVGYDTIGFLSKRLTLDLKSGPIIGLSFDPTNLILVETLSPDQICHLYAVSLIDKLVQYVYMEMGEK